MTVNHAWMIKGWLLGEPNVPDEIMAAIDVVIGSFALKVAQNIQDQVKEDLPNHLGERVQHAHTEKGTTKPETAQKPRNPDNIWDDWQLNKLIEMKKDGWIASEIATSVNKTTTQVNNKWTQIKGKVNSRTIPPGEDQAPSMDGA